MVATVLGLYVLYGFILTPTPIFVGNSSISNSSSSINTAYRLAAQASFEGQISGALGSVLSLMVSYLYSVARDPGGDVIVFPVFVAKVCKHAVSVRLKQGRLYLEVEDDDVEALRTRTMV